MKSAWFVVGIGVIVMLPVRSSARQLPQPIQQGPTPGMTSVARIYILNSARDEAIPVVVHASGDVLPVAVVSGPPVTLAAGATVDTHVSRQAWEYRHLTFKSGEDASAALSTAGADGWEAVGITGSGVGSLQVLLKRPR
jgi:hypothetical protein